MTRSDAGGRLRVTVVATGAVVGDRIEVAGTFGARLRGLMLRRGLEPGEGLLLPGVRSIHMCFMRFPIDAVFLDGDWNVTSVATGLHPWFETARCGRARHTLELPAGAAARFQLVPGTALGTGPSPEFRPGKA